MTEEVRSLVQRRAAIKSQLTRFRNYLDKWSENPDEHQLVERLEKIKVTWNNFEEIQSSLELLVTDSDSINLDDKEREQFERSYFELIALAQRNLTALRPPVVLKNETTQNQSRVQGMTTKIKLPTIQLPNFNGKYDDWLGFYDNFKSIVHDNPDLTPVQKLQYLRSSLKDEAAQVIQALETSSQNYEVAWALLVERYDNRRIIIQSHIRALFELPGLTKESATQLRSLVDATLKHTRALHALGQPTESWDALLLHMITSKLDRNTHKEWERYLDGTEMPSIEELWKFLKNRCHVLESINQDSLIHSNQSTKGQLRPTNVSGNTSQRTRQSLVIANVNLECAICKQNHNVYQCEQFIKMDREARSAKVKSMGLCYNCLRANHLASDCNSITCRKCKRRHHTLLHIENDSGFKSTNDSIATGAGTSTSLQARVESQTLLSTALALILSDNGEPIECRILLDGGSQSNFITEELCRKLKLPLKEVNIPVSGFNQNLTQIRNAVTTTLQSRDRRFSADLSFLVVSRITETLPSQSVNRGDLNIPQNITLADPGFGVPAEVSVLIGAGLFYHLLCVGQIKLNNSELILQKTRLGWIVAGPAPIKNSTPNRVACNLVVGSLNAQVMKFWELEEVPSVKYLSEVERSSVKHFHETHSRDQSGRYIVRLPFNDRKQELGDSYQIAKKRFYSLEKRLLQDAQTYEEYSNFLREYESLGHMAEISEADASEEGYFIPHHPVIKQDSCTTKLRVVFDASSKTSTGTSLNEALQVGPTLQEELFSIVTRFRTHRYVLSADIEKMYRQVQIHPEDAKYQRILWRRNKDDPITIFQLGTVTYGTNCAPYLAVQVLQNLAESEQHRFPLASKIAMEDVYMDDFLTGASTLEEAQRLRDELIALLASGGFSLRKWCSNEQTLLEPLMEKSTDPYICLNDSETQKTLGIRWHPSNDCLVHTITTFCKKQRTTKRTMLSQVASLFDPLGLLGPVIVKAKIMLQQLWEGNLDWDESIPLEVETSWKQYKEQLECLNTFIIPRRVIKENAIQLQLHGFCDASERAYGAVLYVRSTSMETHTVRLVCSKTRVAPIKKQSLPRLELCAAVLLAKLYVATNKALRISFDEIFFWSDSMITLHWIRTSPHKLKCFVANRVSQIQESTDEGRWRYVPSQDNPADALSRGQYPRNFMSNDMWQEGPSWLSKNESLWPVNSISEMEIPEQRSVVVLHSSNRNEWEVLAKFSSFNKLKRIISYCIRFAANCRARETTTEDGQVEELKDAEMRILRLVQLTAFEKEMSALNKMMPLDKKSKILSLSPFIDANGILRVGGRLKCAEIESSQKYPILLPAEHHITRTIIRETHFRLCHAGAQATLYAVRENYWPLNGKNLVKGIIRECLPCCRWNLSTPEYHMGNLPKSRLACTRPFENVGTDFCGPFLIKEKKQRNRNKIKIYVAIFVCLVTKAVHLETVSELSTEAFLACLKRFFARRGKARLIQSDNATNFVGADNHLKELYNFLCKKENRQPIDNYLTSEGIQWSFIPPRSPHFGGIWEAAVKGFKHHMRRTIGETLFTFEEFNTFVIEVEAILNSRPLTSMSSDPNDPLALTPAHFLINASLQSIPEYDFIDVPANRLSSWQHIQKVKQHFWQRWHKEYLNELQQRAKWITNKDSNIKIGDLVIIKEDNTPPLRWVIGRVTALHPGDDDIVRVISVKTTSGVYKRGVKKIVLLPVA